jgi:DNA repair protein RecO (recombination protein O)
MNKERTEAIILRNFGLMNGDVIITLFTPFLGKFSVVAKQGKVSRKRFGGALDILTKVELEYFEKQGSNLGKLTTIDVQDDYSELKKDYDKIMLATYFLDLVQHFHPDKLSAPNSYKLLSMVLTYMNTNAPLGNMLEAFQVKLLCAAGLKPYSRVCSTCGKDLLSVAQNICSFELNAVYCSSCNRSDRNVSVESLSFVNTVSMSPIKNFLGIEANSSISEDLRYFIDFHVDSHLNKRLKSRDMVHY